MKSEDVIKNALDYFDLKNDKYKNIFSKFRKHEVKYSHTDITNSYIKFFDENNNLKVKSNVQLIANYYPNENLFVWAWGIPEIEKNLNYLSRKILSYGLDIHEDENYYLKSLLINSRLYIRNIDELYILLSLSLYLTKKDFFIIADQDKGTTNFEDAWKIYLLYNININ